MVNANGHPTRAPARDKGHVFNAIVIDSAHRFFAANGKHQRDQHLASFKAAFNKLSPATRRVLQAVRVALFKGYDRQQGYTFKPFVNRAAIAHELGRDSLVPYDIRMLRALASKGLLIEGKRALPRKQYGEIWLGAGAEFIYAIPQDVLFCFLAFDPDEKQRIVGLVRLAADQTKAKESLAKRDKQAQEFDYYRKLYSDKPQERSLLKRITDWFSW